MPPVVIRSCRGDRLKTLVWDRDGFVLWYELDYAQASGWATLSMSYLSGAAQVIVPPAAYVKIFPNAAATHNPGESQTVSVVALDNAGRALSGVPVKLVISGAHAGQQTAVTDISGYASFTYQGTKAGVADQLQAQVQYGHDWLVSPVLIVNWNSLPNHAPIVTVGEDQTATWPNTIQLTGTATDDGLPTVGTMTVTWSKVSGPGTVPSLRPTGPSPQRASVSRAPTN